MSKGIWSINDILNRFSEIFVGDSGILCGYIIYIIFLSMFMKMYCFEICQSKKLYIYR